MKIDEAPRPFTTDDISTDLRPERRTDDAEDADGALPDHLKTFLNPSDSAERAATADNPFVKYASKPPGKQLEDDLSDKLFDLSPGMVTDAEIGSAYDTLMGLDGMDFTRELAALAEKDGGKMLDTLINRLAADEPELLASLVGKISREADSETARQVMKGTGTEAWQNLMDAVGDLYEEDAESFVDAFGKDRIAAKSGFEAIRAFADGHVETAEELGKSLKALKKLLPAPARKTLGKILDTYAKAPKAYAEGAERILVNSLKSGTSLGIHTQMDRLGLNEEESLQLSQNLREIYKE